jgi:hypothetical protein
VPPVGLEPTGSDQLHHYLGGLTAAVARIEPPNTATGGLIGPAPEHHLCDMQSLWRVEQIVEAPRPGPVSAPQLRQSPPSDVETTAAVESPKEIVESAIGAISESDNPPLLKRICRIQYLELMRRYPALVVECYCSTISVIV